MYRAMDNSSNNDGAPILTTGQRIKFLRMRRGMTREVLAGLVGKSESWLKQVENGVLQQPRLPMLILLAEALRVGDLSELTGGQSIPVRMFTGPGHPALGEVRAAVNATTLLSAGEVQPLDTLRARLDAAWRMRHASPDHRTVLGGVLPGLIRDAQLAVKVNQSDMRRRAQAILAEVYGLSQMYLAYQPAADLLWRVADRALLAAEESEDPLALACATWFLAQAHRDCGDMEAALEVNTDAMAAIAPHMDDASTDLLAMWGALTFELAYTHSRMGSVGEAWSNWEEAARIAERLPMGYYHPITSFSRVILRAHAVTVAVELHSGGEAARQAAGAEAQPIPSRPRKGRHLIETARAHRLARDEEAVLGTLQMAQREAPETIRYNGYARQMVLELTEGSPSLRPQAHILADQIGLLV